MHSSMLENFAVQKLPAIFFYGFLQFYTNPFLQKISGNFFLQNFTVFYSFLQNPAGTFFTILLQFFYNFLQL